MFAINLKAGNATFRFFMIKKITAGLALGLLMFGQGFAQSSQICAEGRLKNAQRTALASASQERLMQKYDVNFYKLDISLERTSTFVQGMGLIQARVRTQPLDTFAFELHPNLQIDSIRINNVLRAVIRQS